MLGGGVEKKGSGRSFFEAWLAKGLSLIEGTPEILLCMFRLNCMRALILVGSRGTPFPSCFGVSFLVEEPLEVLGPGLSALSGQSVTI